MTDLVPPTGRIHWVGAGLSTGSGLRVLASDHDVVLWARTVERAERCLSKVGATGLASARAFDHDTLAGELRPGDVVVSMLPATEHLALVRLCVDRSAHFACSSYLSDDVAALASTAADRGLVVLAEAGLDPGIDHLLAHLLVARAGEVGGTAAFTSYCGGLPAVPNDFRYRFSWAPRSVLTALRTPARYVEHGKETAIARPWEATRTLLIGGEKFETYPNRDSIPFIDRYRVRWPLDTFIRGTVRLDGWRDAWADVFPVLDDESRIDTTATELAHAHPMTELDQDRVILSVALRIVDDDEVRWSGEYLLDTVGDRTETAMARTVSVTLACGVLDILAGATTPGAHRAADDAKASTRWLTLLRHYGVLCEFRRPNEP
ncbi:saccharopine dehydrogenase family protein [Umezawaea sp. Da 62-37]|uniref:saccharopine dehydrogenase family protein n=1 Tax=Umezawaea sp. Da 62-37 TaxID=3075927 RepID=UPI0028F6D2B6|nr:saccharopine dehydrogenase family protein [Umezawaea sp. Da 62-37]WNV85121.1 saccharopine dehydrogenase family protein [Umezawaea sp. Da 62-37]